MRTYEAVCVFRAEADKFATGKDAVRNAITGLGAQELKEDDMQIRPLTFAINKQYQGHYYLYTFGLTPEQAHKIEHEVRLVPELMRILVARKDN